MTLRSIEMSFHPKLALIQVALPEEVQKSLGQRVVDLIEVYGLWGLVGAVAVWLLGKLAWIYWSKRIEKKAELDALRKKPPGRTKPEPPAIEAPPREVTKRQGPEARERLAPDLVHPYPLQPNFTGRIAEREWLTEWFTADPRPVCVVEAIGGMGKSALAWFWLHADVLGTPPAGYSKADPENLRVPEERHPEGVLFWSFYERDSHFGAFLDRAALYVGASDVSTAALSDREKLDIVLGALGQRRILVILDGFERELCAYAGYRAPYQGDEAGGGDGNDCVDPRAAYFLQAAASLALAGRVLLTSRLFPNEMINLAGCRHERLENLASDDVVSFFEATGVKGTRAEIAQAVASYGGHPLSVSLLARAIVKDRRMRGDIKASGRHTVLDKLKGKHGHDILEVAYDEMSAERRELLSRIAAFRSPMDYEALEAVATLKGAELDAALDELEARGLLLRDADGARYDLHPIVRQYAYDRLADKAGVHGRLREYFEARPAPQRVETLDDLAPTIELYWHTVGAGRFDAAWNVYHERLWKTIYYRFGAYDRQIEMLGALFPDGEERSPQLQSESDQGWALNELANSYSLSGQPGRAVPLFEMHNELCEKADDKENLTTGLGNLAYMAQLPWGRLEAAEGTLRRSIELCREIADELQEAVSHQNLGRLLTYEGRFAEAEHELEASTSYSQETEDKQGLCVDEAYRALLSLLRGDAAATLAAARKSRRLADFRGNERDIIRAEWLLGWAHTALGETTAAEPHLNEALTRCRRINMVDLEPSILLALARLHQDRESALKALAIAGRCEYRLNQAEIHNFLARLAPRRRQARRSPRPRPKNQGLRLLRRPAALLQTGLRRSRALAGRGHRSTRSLRLEFGSWSNDVAHAFLGTVSPFLATSYSQSKHRRGRKSPLLRWAVRRGLGFYILNTR